jgi:hypothetical protein
MGDTVIYPKAFQGRPRPAMDDRIAETRSREIGRLKSIEHIDGLAFKRLEDRMIAARALGRLLDQVKDRGYSMDKIRHKAGRIERYVLPSTAALASPETQERAKRNLMQKVRGYRKMAENFAELLQSDPSDAKISVLNETSIWTHATRPRTEDSDERAWHLCWKLREMVDHVVRRRNIVRLFAQGHRVPGRWDIEAAAFRKNASACFPLTVYENWFEEWSEAPPLPSVPLLRLLHAEFEVDLLVESNGTQEPRRDKSRYDEDFSGAQQISRIRLYRDIRLAIGPTTAPDEISGLFESRAWADLSFRSESGDWDEPRPIDPPWCTWLTFHRCSQVFLDGTWRRIRVLTKLPEANPSEVIKALAGESIDDPLAWNHTPLSDNKNCFEHYWFSWTPINEGYVQHWFDRPCVPAHVDCLAPHGTAALPKEFWYCEPSVAHEVEISLHDGGLERDLSIAADALWHALEARTSEWRSAATQATQDLIGRWNLNESANGGSTERNS